LQRTLKGKQMTTYGDLKPGDTYITEMAGSTFLVTDLADDDWGHYFAVNMITGEIHHVAPEDEVIKVPHPLHDLLMSVEQLEEGNE